MYGLTNVQRQQSTYLPPTTLEVTAKNRVNLHGVPCLEPVSDLSAIYPEAVVTSSEALGWQNLRAIHMQQRSEWTMPPLENHCLIIQLGPPVTVSARIDRYGFEKC